MKLNSLPALSLTQRFDSPNRWGDSTHDDLWHVDASEAAHPDRDRSARQELSAVDPTAVGDFNGQARVLADARAVAARIAELGDHADQLVRPAGMACHLAGIDDAA